MGFTIKEIRNLSNGVLIYSSTVTTALFTKDGAKKATFTVGETDGYNDIVVFTTNTEASGLATKNDNIQVIWVGDDSGKTENRAAGGKLVVTDEKKRVVITGLENYTKYIVDLKGKIDIGPDPQNPAVQLSVRMGNATGDTIIDFSDKSEGSDPSRINLKDLIAWVQGKTGDETGKVELPVATNPDGTPLPSGNQPSADKFEVVFNEFHFNITRKSFNLEVQSVQGQSITFGVFTLKEIGFRITNEPYKAPKDPKAPQLPPASVE